MSSLKEAESAGDSEQRGLSAAVMEVETRSDTPVSWAEKAGCGRWVGNDPESRRQGVGRLCGWTDSSCRPGAVTVEFPYGEGSPDCRVPVEMSPKS